MTTQDHITLLLVDDEPMMISVIQAMLGHLNCQVITTMSALEAVELYQEHQQTIDLVIVDQMMPNMTGLVLAKKLYELNANIKVILMTGSSVEDFEARTDTIGIVDYLQKPFTFEDLEAVIGRVSKLIT